MREDGLQRGAGVQAASLPRGRGADQRCVREAEAGQGDPRHLGRALGREGYVQGKVFIIDLVYKKK